MPRIYHKILINLSTYLTIFGVVLNEFAQHCSIVCCIVQYPTIPNNIISLHSIACCFETFWIMRNLTAQVIEEVYTISDTIGKYFTISDNI